MWLRELFAFEKPIIGMVHLPPLPGAPNHGEEHSMEEIIRRALDEAFSLKEGGVHGIMVENYGDRPLPKDRCDPATLVAMGIVVRELRERIGLPLGVNMLRNCAREALAVAYVAGAHFIRVNAYSQTIVSDQGLIEPVARKLQEYRRYLGALGVKVLADVNVKHAAPLVNRPLEEVVEETLDRGGADAVIITGPRTGEPPLLGDLEVAKEAAGARPVLVGSGLTPENAPLLLRVADGAIVGTYFKRGGRVDVERVKALMESVRELVE